MSPPSFDLEAEWEAITTDYVENSMRITVAADVDTSLIPSLRVLGVETVVDHENDDGSTHATLGAFDPRVLAIQICGLMSGIELIDPPDELVEHLAEIGAELAGRFPQATQR